MKRLYLNNLPYWADAKSITELLRPYGEATRIEILMDREAKRPKGFAYADLPDDAAQRAVKSLNGSEYGGRTIRVEMARPKTPRPLATRNAAEGVLRR